MTGEEMESEIKQLHEFKNKNSHSVPNRKIAKEIVGNIETFLSIDRHSLKYSGGLFDEEKSARIDFDDALENFKTYIDSNLKKKHDWHYTEGISKLSLGVSEAVSLLRFMNQESEEE